MIMIVIMIVLIMIVLIMIVINNLHNDGIIIIMTVIAIMIRANDGKGNQRNIPHFG